jgi:hypothetical protein
MCIAVSTTPGNLIKGLKLIPRQKMKKAEEMIGSKGASIPYYEPPENAGLSSVELKPFN